MLAPSVNVHPPLTNRETTSYANFDYIYQYKDHLGNVRLSYTKDVLGNIEVVEEDNYGPFGMKHTGYNNVVTSTNIGQKYKYLGQERQDEMGLNWDTFRYRNYDYAIGRFFGVDPIAEDYMSISPYQFAHNNPVWKIELEGLEGVETSGTDVINREPRILAVFYHGGPTGDGQIRKTTADTGGTGDRYNATAA